MQTDQIPKLYQLIDKKNLEEMLQAFGACIALPVQLLDEQGKVLDTFGSSTRYCTLFQKAVSPSHSCIQHHANASKRAVEFGETYIFSCHANLNHMVFPLLNHSQFLGSILVGPFLMDKPDALLFSEQSKQYHFSPETLLELYEEVANIPVIAPTMVTQISRLLYYLFANLIPDSKQQFLFNKNKLYQQSLINDSIQRYKTSEPLVQNTYPYDKEKDLIVKVKTGNASEAKGVLNDLLGYVLFSGGNSLEFVKSRAIELCSLLSRAAIEGGAATDAILRINNQFLKSLQEINTLDILCFKLQEIVEVFTDSMFNSLPEKGNDAIRKAIQYISQHYASPLSLQEVADYVHLNATYFSTLFKQSTGSSFKDYLNMVRIEESKRLLANTDYSIINIAIATGFEDQSYFSKVFRKYTGLTPKQYR